MDDLALIFRGHAIQQMFRRHLTEIDVRTVLEDGETIEDYPDDLPYPAKLILGWVGLAKTPVHVVASFDLTSNTIYIVTVYEPDPALWTDGFRRRKAP